ncbi:tRNA1(Val) (adenine(37)-N6)-methyltransferase [Anaerobacillus sp. MEB173]|uniref:tRNA1(Val) (adenine(37)-N6)-methyltransferase n=1 Tax=Anaerobacillus sp. MEB173 TaxID=3383345 RepID=UPI003F9236B3
MVTLNEGERLDYLLHEDLKIVQSQQVFSFSIDAILLAAFAYVPIQKGKIVDLCTGNGVIPIALTKRTKAHILGVEIQERLYDMAVRSVQVNHLEQQIQMINADIKELPKRIEHGQFDVVTCNPPYFNTISEDELNRNEHYAIARHEIYCTLDDVIKVSSQLVKQKGKVALVHRPGRLTDIITLMRKYRIEPKRIQFVHPKKDKDANMILIEGMKDGKQDIKVLPPIFVYNENNEYTKEFSDIYYGRI